MEAREIREIRGRADLPKGALARSEAEARLLSNAPAAAPKARSSPASTRTMRIEGGASVRDAMHSSVSSRPGSGGVLSVPRTACIPAAV